MQTYFVSRKQTLQSSSFDSMFALVFLNHQTIFFHSDVHAQVTEGGCGIKKCIMTIFALGSVNEKFTV